MAFLLHDPDDSIRYSIDFADWGTVSSAVWSVTPVGPTVTDEGEATNIATASLADVEFGKTYELTCKATLSSSEIVSKSITIRGGHK